MLDLNKMRSMLKVEEEQKSGLDLDKMRAMLQVEEEAAPAAVPRKSIDLNKMREMLGADSAAPSTPAVIKEERPAQKSLVERIKDALTTGKEYTAEQEQAAKYGIIADDEDTQAERLSKKYSFEGRVEAFDELANKDRYNKTYADTFIGQTKANNAAAALAEKESLAWSKYLDSGSDADFYYATQLSNLRERFTEDNAEALDDENVKAGWISKTMAGYLPQLASQAKYAAAGIAPGLIAANPALAKAGYTASQTAYGYQVMRGAAYKTLVEEGVDPELARKAAQDEAVIGGLIEGAEALFTLGTKGAKLFSKAAGKDVATDTLKAALKKYGINIGSEALEEGAQEAVSYANQNREDKGAGVWNLAGEGLKTGAQALAGQNKEAAQQIGAAAGEGAKIAAMFGAASSAGSYLGQQRLAQRVDEAAAVQTLTVTDRDGVSLPVDGNVSAGFMQLARQRISDFVDKALGANGRTDEPYNQRRISRVPRNVAEMVSAASNGNIDISDKYFALHGTDLQHEYDNHSNAETEVSRQQIPLTAETMKEAIEAFYDPDFVDAIFIDDANPTQRQSIVYAKKANGHYVVVVAIGGKRNPNIVPVMVLNFSETKMEQWAETGKPIFELLYENNPAMFRAAVESAEKKELGYRSESAALHGGPTNNTLRSPQSSTPNIADGALAVNPRTAPSQYATNTMQQAAAAGTLGQETADTFADAQHRVVGWDETTTNAQDEINKRGATGAAQDLINKANSGQAFTSTDVQKGQILMQQLSKSAVQTDRDLAIELGEAVIRAASDIGRALNIMRSMIRELPGGLLRVTQRQVEKAGGTLSEQDIADITALEEIIRQLPEIQQMEGTALMARMGTLTADMSDAYRKDVSTVFSEDPANAEKWLLLLTQKKVSERTSASLKDKFTARQRINLLLNPKTQVRNIAGNLLSFGMESGSDVFAGAVDKALAKKTGQRTTGSGEFGAALSGAKAGAAEVNLARKLGVTNLLNNRYAEGQARPAQVFGENDLAAPMSNWLNDLTSYLLTMGDAVFSGAREAQVSAQLEGLGTDSRVAAGLAETAGREVTFQNDSKISKKLLAARKEVLGDGIISRIIMPFAKTPANILSRAISYSPAGLIEGAYAASKVISGSDLSPEMQRKAATAIGRGLFGSMVTLAGAGLAAAGKASGAAPEDKDEAAFMKDVGGVLPNSIKIGNTWVDLSNIGPGMVALNLGATIYHELQREGVDGNLGAQITEALLNGIVMDVTGDSLWQGILDTVAYFENGDVWGFMQNAAGDALSQMIPLQSFLRAITGSVDKYKRETSAKGGDFGWSVNYILSNIPGLSQKLPIKYDVTGEAVERYEGGKASDIFNAWLNPAAGMSKDKTDSELYQRVMELYEKEGSKSIFPTVSPYSVEYKGEKYALRGADRSEYQQTSGKDITAQLDELFASAAYKQATSEQQVEMMADLISNSTAEAKTGFLAKQGVAYEKSGVSSTIDKLAAYDVPASAVVLLAATDTSNDKDVRNSGAVKAAKAAIKLGLSTEAEYALIEHYGSKTIAESVKRARQYKVDPAAYLDTFQGLSGAENASQLKSVLRGSSVRGEALLSMLTESAEGRYGRFDGRWTVNGRSYAALTPETYVLCVCSLDGDLNKAGNIKKLMELGLSEAAAGDFYTVYKSNSDRYN